MQPTNRAAWLRVWIFASCLLAGCEGPGAQIALEPLGPRPDAAADEDAGPELPEGATPCKKNSECDDGVECTVDECLTQGYCSVRIDSSFCSDGIVCNGLEACDPAQGGCVPGVTADCDDGDPCTIDHCEESAKDCVHDPRDFDRDGEADYHCAGGTDCDDRDDHRGSNAPEICNDGLDNDCDEMIDEATCGGIDHDTCADPFDISAGGSFELPLTGAFGDYTSSCDSSDPQRDLVLTFQLDEPSDVKFQASGILGDGTTAEIAGLSIQRECGNAQSEVRCARSFPADLRVRALPAGRYFLVVSSIPASRTIQFDASFGPATAPQPNATCDKATPVGPQGGHFEGDLVMVGDEITNSCTVEGQPDVFYSIHLDAESDIEITAFATEPQPRLAVSLRDGCGPGQEGMGRCDSGVRVYTRYYQQPAGDYILVVEGPIAEEIGFMLDVAISQPTPPPHGDNCRDPLTIAVGDTQRIALSGLRDDDTVGTCQSRGPDAVLALTVPIAQDIQIEADADGEPAYVAFQSTCGDSRSERQCRTGTPVNTRIHNVGAGSYFLVVDSPAPGLTLAVKGLPLTPLINVSGNDTCYSATEVPADGGLFAGDTRLLINDYSSVVCGGGAESKDAAFRLVLTGRKRVVASVDAGFDSVLMRYGMASGSSDLCTGEAPENCNDDTGIGNGGGALLDEILDPGTYYYVIDGYKDFNAGSYLFEVSVNAI